MSNNRKNKTGIHLSSIDKAIWEEFKNMTILKHSKLHGALSQEVEKALAYYLKHNIHTQQKSIQKKMNNKEQNFVKIAKQLLKYNTISHKTLTDLIIKIANISDFRTINSYIKSFIAMEWIIEITEIPTQEVGEIYKIDHDMINVILVRYEEKYNVTFDF